MKKGALFDLYKQKITNGSVLIFFLISELHWSVLDICYILMALGLFELRGTSSENGLSAFHHPSRHC